MDMDAQIEALRPQQASTLTTQQIMEELHDRVSLRDLVGAVRNA